MAPGRRGERDGGGGGKLLAGGPEVELAALATSLGLDGLALLDETDPFRLAVAHAVVLRADELRVHHGRDLAAQIIRALSEALSD